MSCQFAQTSHAFFPLDVIDTYRRACDGVACLQKRSTLVWEGISHGTHDILPWFGEGDQYPADLIEGSIREWGRGGPPRSRQGKSNGRPQPSAGSVTVRAGTQRIRNKAAFVLHTGQMDVLCCERAMQRSSSIEQSERAAKTNATS